MKIKKLLPILSLFVLTVLLSCMLGVGVCAAEPDSAAAPTESASAQTDDGTGTKAIAAAAVVGVVAAVGAGGMAMAISKSAESMARQPEAAGKINSAMMLGLVFIETAIIYALIVAILIIFVL